MNKSIKIYKQRRNKLLRLMAPNSAALIPSASLVVRNRDVEYKFRQDSDFYYLTGFSEPNALLLLIPGGKYGQSILFCQDRDPSMEIWTGHRLGWRRAQKALDLDKAYNFDDLDKRMPTLFEGVDTLYTEFGNNSRFDKQVLDWVAQARTKIRSGLSVPSRFLHLSEILHEMRLIKSASEVKSMKYAADVSAQAHIRAMQKCIPGMYEYQLQSELEYVFGQHGCTTAYSSIVGAGANSCILHYVDNNAMVKPGDLVLIDAGAEYDCYAADITRTFPASGYFNSYQREIYDLVLEAQLAAIKKAKPGNTWNAPDDAAIRVISRGLKEIGLLKGDLKKIIKDGSYRKFYMHKTGHWLGMDVHDVGKYKLEGRWREFQPGMVLTVEPGIYISPGERDVDKVWRKIGVRIEDDVLITRDGNQVLTDKVPKLADDIESLVGSTA